MRITRFIPDGAAMTDIGISKISMSEIEAIRLVDSVDLMQEEAAKRMGISRSTLWKNLKTGRKKLIDAIVGGNVIEIRQEVANKSGNDLYRKK